ncbi:MAG TPA: efflux RND transporter permease subunit [Pseudomonadales bacterium]
MDIFVRRPTLALVVSVVILLSGLFAVTKIPVLQFPQIESTSLQITTAYFGASAEVVQGFITETIEEVAMTIPGVDYVDSTTTAGTSSVTAWLELNADSTRALAELTTRLAQIGYELPEGAEDPAVAVVRADRSSALFYLDVKGDAWTRTELTDFMERQVTPLLAGIDGVQRVDISGGRAPAMRVWIDPAKIAALNIGADEVMAAIRANNVIATVGRSENSEQRFNLLSNATLQTADDFRRLVVVERENAIIRLGDIARIEVGETRGDSNARFDNDTTIYLAVWPMPGANEIEIGDALYVKLAEINDTLPDDLEIRIVEDGTTYMRASLNEIFKTLFETILLVAIVVLCLMGSFRTSLVPLVTIPISLLGAVAVIHLLGFSLNLLTVLAVVLSVGLVVDDAIVVVENVSRHVHEGKSRTEAALLSARELFTPIVAMTFTLAAVYTPIGFVSGFSGALFQEFALTLAVAVIISGIVAITLSPVMSSWVVAETGRESRMTKRVNAAFEGLKQRYEHLLARSFAWRNQILFVALFISALMVPFYMFSATELAPVEDQSGVFLIIEAPPEASLEYTEDYMHDVIEQIQANVPGLESVWQIVNPNNGFGGIELVPFEERDQSVEELLPAISAQLSGITGLRVFPSLSASLPSAGQSDVEMVVLSTDSYENMATNAQKLVQAAQSSGQFLYANADLTLNLPQYRMVFDHERIADLGLDVTTVSGQLATLLAEMDANRFNSNGKAYRVIPLVENAARGTPDELLDLSIRVPAGGLIPLRSLVTLEPLTSPSALSTFNQQRAFRITGAVIPGTTSGQALTTLENAAADLLPAGYSIDHAGVSRQLRKEGNTMVSVLMISVIVVYLALVVQFNSFRLPLVVLLGSVPLALSGAMLFSFLGLTTINIYAQIGFVTLVGLVAKNGILITEFAHREQERGVSKQDAVRSAASLRLRAVLMTTAATVLGHFPLVLVTGAGAEARNSIGIILVAGMAIGTLFTLFILPSVYLWLAPETETETETDVPALKPAMA